MEHTSDIIIEGSNRDFPSALADVAEGMFTQMGAEQAGGEDSITVSTSASSKEELVVAFLTDVVAECEIQAFTPKSIEVQEYDAKSHSLSAVIRGEKKPPENIIKAVTYHELEIEEKEGSCRIKVLFDI